MRALLEPTHSPCSLPESRRLVNLRIDRRASTHRLIGRRLNELRIDDISSGLLGLRRNPLLLLLERGVLLIDPDEPLLPRPSLRYGRCLRLVRQRWRMLSNQGFQSLGCDPVDLRKRHEV